MNEHYNAANIEQETRDFWQQKQSFKAEVNEDQEKFYCLAMFPYPSGKLHMGHVRNYTISDVIARYQRLLGKNVLQPMGWDAFGLPAEGAAIKNKMAPAKWTYSNIDYMKKQLKLLGFGYDWDRELATCTPDYYRWEQWMFIQLFNKGMVYKKKSVVNWDPVDKTVLANEQVIDGRGWRSGAIVERREIPQWFIKITDYAQELLDELDELNEWPDKVKTMQRNWIGRSEGVRIQFDLANTDQALDVFTTRPDTFMGITYLAVAAEHPLALDEAVNNQNLQRFIEECRKSGTTAAEMDTMEKKGQRLNIEAIHPVTGEKIPVFAANFVLMSYGTGAVMAVPAHDQRDWEFAHKYDIPIKQAVKPADDTLIDLNQAAFTEKGILIDSGIFTGLTSEAAFDQIADHLEKENKGGKEINFKLRDWGVSRQRYWGSPIPMIQCDQCGDVPVPEDQLPVILPENITFDESGNSPIKNMPEWSETSCPTCGKAATRETDTFDTFMESSWYYARYTNPKNDQSMLDEEANYWLPVDHYIGGIEHAILHLLYARFYHKLLRDAGMVKSNEPFKRLLTQGMVIAETWKRENEDGSLEWFNPADIDKDIDEKGKILGGKLKSDGQSVIAGGIEKMSKSKNNGIDPQTLINQYGADTVRLYVMFTSPPEQSLEWSDHGVEGANRFLHRLWTWLEKHQAIIKNQPTLGEQFNPKQADLRRELHQQLKQSLFDYQRQHFNTVISACMKILNRYGKLQANAENNPLICEAASILLRLLAPIAPHISQHAWHALNFGDDILKSKMPEVDESALKQDQIELMLQVNNKLRGKIKIAIDASKEEIENMALAHPKAQQFIGDKTIRKIIIVPKRLINIVAN